MKYFNLILAVLITISAFTTVTYTACKKDPCKDVACKNGGVCNGGKCVCPIGFSGTNCEIDACNFIDCKNGAICKSGKCICPAGYEGDSCQIPMSNKFTTYWIGDQTCTPAWGGPATQRIWIDVGATPTTVKVYFENNTQLIVGTIDHSNVVVLPKTVFSPSKTLDGGTLTYIKEGDRLQGDYTYTLSGNNQTQTMHCVVTYDVEQ